MSSGFITESEILEARRRRQEEWDKVRTDDQPKEAPEEAYDTRPLFQRLEEQRLKKEAEYEEAHKLKNMIRGLDDEEVGFLDLVEQTKAKAALIISLEEQKEMREFRERVSNLAESEEMSRLRAQLAPARPAAAVPSQSNKLQGVVVRKRKASELDDKSEKSEPELKPPAAKSNGMSDTGVTAVTDTSVTAVTDTSVTAVTDTKLSVSHATMRCIGVLPGLGHYDTDSTSDSDAESSDPDSTDKCCKYDLLGRAPEHNDKRKDETKS